jgi:hypothetical protein
VQDKVKFGAIYIFVFTLTHFVWIF